MRTLVEVITRVPEFIQKTFVHSINLRVSLGYNLIILIVQITIIIDLLDILKYVGKELLFENVTTLFLAFILVYLTQWSGVY